MKQGTRRACLIGALAAISIGVAAPPASAAPDQLLSMLPSPSYTGGVPTQTAILIQNNSSGGEDANFPEIFVAPGCASGGGYCTPAEGREPGLFTLSSTGTGSGADNRNCDGTWNIVESSQIPGVWRLFGPIPGLQLNDGEECIVSFTATANRIPLTDVDLALAGAQTYFVLTVRAYFFAGDVLTEADETSATVLPGAPAAPVTTATVPPTGQRAAALAKCKKKKSKKQRKKCRKAALRLPV